MPAFEGGVEMRHKTSSLSPVFNPGGVLRENRIDIDVDNTKNSKLGTVNDTCTKNGRKSLGKFSHQHGRQAELKT